MARVKGARWERAVHIHLSSEDMQDAASVIRSLVSRNRIAVDALSRTSLVTGPEATTAAGVVCGCSALATQEAAPRHDQVWTEISASFSPVQSFATVRAQSLDINM